MSFSFSFTCGNIVEDSGGEPQLLAAGLRVVGGHRGLIDLQRARSRAACESTVLLAVRED